MKVQLWFATTSALVCGCASEALAVGSTSFLSQIGADQVANVDQLGATNGQIGTIAAPFLQKPGVGGGVVSGNIVTITQTNVDDGAGNRVNGSQTGLTNDATILQAGNAGDVLITQEGSNNGKNVFHTIDQASTTDHASVTLSETGNGNIFSISQGGGTLDSVIVKQIGDTNTVHLTQFGDRLSVNATQDGPSSLNKIDSNQLGNTNSLTVTQSGGGSHVVNNNQDGAGNSATISQFGSSQTANNTQSGGGSSPLGNDVHISQFGMGNLASNKQSGTGGSATFVQTGSDNRAVLTDQFGSSNIALLVQSDTHNSVTLQQNGTTNNASSTQLGSYQYALLTQNGSANLIVGLQQVGGNSPTLGNSAIVTQGVAGATSSNNTAVYTQTGTGHSLIIKQ